MILDYSKGLKEQFSRELNIYIHNMPKMIYK